ncbi:unnamed protein product [Pleuronectes platessa]|uniref:Uncharacterized protein n=1 Tax=Pleuronectes platessa TaxID=8262 RepID=A0A9N7UBW7_PLEPL|nr:unnamed protein product [Pleuronectes platessa]
MVANGSASVWELGGRGIKVWKVEKSEFQAGINTGSPLPPSAAAAAPGKAHQLMKCENTCGCGSYGLSEIQLHKLMIKSMSLRRGFILKRRCTLLWRRAGRSLEEEEEEEEEERGGGGRGANRDNRRLTRCLTGTEHWFNEAGGTTPASPRPCAPPSPYAHLACRCGETANTSKCLPSDQQRTLTPTVNVLDTVHGKY